MRIKSLQNNPNWRPSLGDKLDKVHFRNGHLHAECDPVTGKCSIHYDKHDPYESLTELSRHLWKSNLGKVLIIGGAIALGLAVLKSR